MEFSTLFTAVCVSRSLYIIEDVATMDQGLFPEAHTGCAHVFLPLCLKNFACLSINEAFREEAGVRNVREG